MNAQELYSELGKILRDRPECRDLQVVFEDFDGRGHGTTGVRVKEVFPLSGINDPVVPQFVTIYKGGS